MHRLLFLQYGVLTFTRITLLLPLVIISPLHNHKQDVGNIDVRDPIACISRALILERDLEEKSVTFTQVYIYGIYVTNSLGSNGLLYGIYVTNSLGSNGLYIRYICH